MAQGPTVWWHPGVTGQSFLRGQGIPGGLPVDWQPVTHVYINECVCASVSREKNKHQSMNVSWAPLEDNDGEVQLHQMGQQSTPVFEMSQCHLFLRSDGTTTGLHQCLTTRESRWQVSAVSAISAVRNAESRLNLVKSSKILSEILSETYKYWSRTNCFSKDRWVAH